MSEIFKSSKKIVEDALNTIKLYQTGEIKPAKTGYDYIDQALMGGIRPQKCIAIGGRTGTGKSYVAQKIKEAIMNPDINEQANEYILLNCEFEMNPVDLLLRRMSREMHIPIEDIINRKPIKSEQEEIDFIASKEANDRIFYIPKPCSIEEFYDGLNNRFLPTFKDKKLVIVSIDHIALIKRMGLDPKKAIDLLLAHINEMKLKFKNVFFFIITQFNREIENRTDPKTMAPRLSDVYQSDELAQLCELVIGLHNPYSLGIQRYMLFPASRYENMNRFKAENKTQFMTEGLTFHHILKIRMKDMNDNKYPLDDLFIETRRGYEERYMTDEGRFFNDKKNHRQEEPEEESMPF